ncbi:MAG: response regulator, partial [Rhodospirillales bacterium]|nr:response regulator [Rhodospirillales bacterium]
LPRWPRQPEGTRTPRPSSRSPVSAGETILVVEDDEAVRRASVDALQELGYTVLQAPDAMEAIRVLIDRGGIDLLFTDIGLPGGVDGRALADAARNAAPDVKILFTTGYTRAAGRSTGRLDPGAHLLPKPFTLQQLGAKVREILDAPPPSAAPRSVPAPAPAGGKPGTDTAH